MLAHCKLKAEEIQILDLSGLDGLTNLALTLEVSLGNIYPNLQQVELTGCVHLTDIGIMSLASLQKLTKVIYHQNYGLIS